MRTARRHGSPPSAGQSVLSPLARRQPSGHFIARWHVRAARTTPPRSGPGHIITGATASTSGRSPSVRDSLERLALLGAAPRVSTCWSRAGRIRTPRVPSTLTPALSRFGNACSAQGREWGEPERCQEPSARLHPTMGRRSRLTTPYGTPTIDRFTSEVAPQIAQATDRTVSRSCFSHSPATRGLYRLT